MRSSRVLPSRFLCGLTLTTALSLAGCQANSPQPPQKSPSAAPSADLGAPAEMQDSSDTMPPVQAPEPIVPTAAEEKAPPAKENPAAAATKWTSLFDGKTLAGWKSIEFGGEGEVAVTDGKIVMQRGSDITGIVYTGDPLPKVNYEIAFEAQRIDGLDFFSGLVFPYKGDYCSFVVGGWGGGVIGLSSVDGIYANENSTASHEVFKQEQWYRIRLRVGDTFVRAWIDDKNVIDLDLTDHKLSVHPAVDLAKPLGITCYATIAGLRRIYFRELTEEESAGKETPAPALPAAETDAPKS